METTHHATWVCLATAVMALLVTAAQGKIIYVDKAGYSGGMSWLRAYPSLDAALEASEDGDEIRISQGTYTPPGISLLPWLRRQQDRRHQGGIRRSGGRGSRSTRHRDLPDHPERRYWRR